MPVPIHVVDAFASAPFTGNPAGVVVTDRPLAPEVMRAIAAEMKHAETAFAVPGETAFSLRWFTPAAEVDLCGHATLATAHVLWETGRVARDRAIAFSTRSGMLDASMRRDERIELDFPALRVSPPSEPIDLAPALGVPVVETWQTRFDILAVAESEADVRRASPDFRALGKLPVRGVMLTARCADRTEVDFVSRFFAPAVGVDEDPVTGSAHCALAPFWQSRLGRAALTGAQVGPRGGIVGVETIGERVKLRGHARTVLRGELLL
jgi:PhzF family phenazine biosynthesis protein